tara:strand:- start:35 stop:502 length:468 start_codon:yes stop_codon:yes gene_type:complete
MNFKKGNFVDPNNGFKQGQFKDFGTINEAPSKVTSFMRQFKNNPKYSFLRNIVTGLTFAPILGTARTIGASAIKIYKSKTGVSAAKTIGSKVPSKTSTEIINNRVNQNIKELTKEVPIIGTNRTTKVPLSSDTKGISYANPKISMTAEERFRAGY